MRIFLVILAALIVAGGTGFYVMQGLRPAAPRGGARLRRRKLRQVFVPAQEIAVGTIITPERLSPDGDHRERDQRPDDRGRRGGRDVPGRQRRPPGAAARRSDRPVRHRAAGRPRLPRRRAAQGQAGDHHPGRRDRRPERPRAARRPGRPDPDLFGLRRRRRRRRSAPARRCSTTSGCSPSTSASAPAGPTEDKEGKAEAPPVAKTATLEVTPRQAEIITLAADPRHPVAGAELGPRRRRRRQRRPRPRR